MKNREPVQAFLVEEPVSSDETFQLSNEHIAAMFIYKGSTHVQLEMTDEEYDELKPHLESFANGENVWLEITWRQYERWQEMMGYKRVPVDINKRLAHRFAEIYNERKSGILHLDLDRIDELCDSLPTYMEEHKDEAEGFAQWVETQRQRKVEEEQRRLAELEAARVKREQDLTWLDDFEQRMSDGVTLMNVVHSGTFKKISWEFDESGILVLRGAGQFDVTMFHQVYKRAVKTDPDAVDMCDLLGGIRYIWIEDGITDICENAFSRCQELIGVHFPATLRNIKSEAFQDCRSLCRISLPEGLRYIGREAFEGCVALQEATLPRSMEIFHRSAFEACSIENVFVPAGCVML